MDSDFHGKYFSIVDHEGLNTVIYLVNRTEKEIAKNGPKYTIERVEFSEELIGENRRKTFYIKNPAPDGNPLVILTFGKDKVIVNMGFLDYDVLKISKKPMSMKFSTLYYEEETELMDFEYTKNMQRPIMILDPDTGEEVKSILYFDEATGDVKGKCKLKPHKKYFAFEIRD